jgi:cytochrome P450
MARCPNPRTDKAAPGPHGYPFLGVLPQAWQNPLQFFLEAARRYGDVVALGLGSHRVYLLNHPDYIQYVLRDNHLNYHKGTSIARIKPLFGTGLTTSEGALWRRQRRLLQPAFQHRRIAALAAVMTETTAAALERWRTVATSGQPLDIAVEMRRLTQRIMSKTLFGTDLGSEAETVRQALTTVQESINRRLWAFIDLPQWLPTPQHRRVRRALRTLDQVVYRMIDARRRCPHDMGDLLSWLLRARHAETGKGMSDRQLRDEVMTLFVAGSETTAAALAWTWYLLVTHPDVQRRLEEELTAVVGGRMPTFQDLQTLSYTRMVIEEALRLYPPTWVTARSPLADDEIGGYRIPRQAVVLLSPYVLHRHPTFWEHPAAFDPERFMPAQSTDRPRYAYFPFGGGPRRCIGESFALMEVRLIVAMVTQAYRLHLVPGHPVAPQPLFTLRPRHGVLVTLQPRAAAL